MSHGTHIDESRHTFAQVVPLFSTHVIIITHTHAHTHTHTHTHQSTNLPVQVMTHG